MIIIILLYEWSWEVSLYTLSSKYFLCVEKVKINNRDVEPMLRSCGVPISGIYTSLYGVFHFLPNNSIIILPPLILILLRLEISASFDFW